MAEPVEKLDDCESDIRSKQAVMRVPVMRVFGSTPSGQRACLHLHRVREPHSPSPLTTFFTPALTAYPRDDTDGAHDSYTRTCTWSCRLRG